MVLCQVRGTLGIVSWTCDPVLALHLAEVIHVFPLFMIMFFLFYLLPDPSKAMSDVETIVGVTIGIIAFVLILLLVLIGVIVRCVKYI